MNKIDTEIIERLLRRSQGATMDQMVYRTGASVRTIQRRLEQLNVLIVRGSKPLIYFIDD